MEKLSQISLTCLLAFLIAAKIGNKSRGTGSLLHRKMSFGEQGTQPGTWAGKGEGSEGAPREQKLKYQRISSGISKRMPVVSVPTAPA